jgi:hypothetical protein
MWRNKQNENGVTMKIWRSVIKWRKKKRRRNLAKLSKSVGGAEKAQRHQGSFESANSMAWQKKNMKSKAWQRQRGESGVMSAQ